MKRTGLLLVGHGSRLEYNKELITNTAGLMQEQKPEYIIKSCFMEFNQPTVMDGINAMKMEDIELLVIVPLFLAKGIHIIQNLPRLLNFEPGKMQGILQLNNGRIISILCAEPIGVDPLLAELMLKNAQTAIDMSEHNENTESYLINK